VEQEGELIELHHPEIITITAIAAATIEVQAVVEHSWGQ
jgi:hypothetical protein